MSFQMDAMNVTKGLNIVTKGRKKVNTGYGRKRVSNISIVSEVWTIGVILLLHWPPFLSKVTCFACWRRNGSDREKFLRSSVLQFGVGGGLIVKCFFVFVASCLGVTIILLFDRKKKYKTAISPRESLVGCPNCFRRQLLRCLLKTV